MEKNRGPSTNNNGRASEQEQEQEQTGKQEKTGEEKRQDRNPVSVSLLHFLKACKPVPVAERWESDAYVKVAYWLLEMGWSPNSNGRQETLNEAAKYPLAMWADVVKRLLRAEELQQVEDRIRWIRGVAKKVWWNWKEELAKPEPKAQPQPVSPGPGNGPADSLRPGDTPQRARSSTGRGSSGGNGGPRGRNGGGSLGGVLGEILSDIERRHRPGSVERTGTPDGTADHSALTLGDQHLFGGFWKTPEDARKFINGYN